MLPPHPRDRAGSGQDELQRRAGHYEAYIGALVQRLPRADRKAFKHVVADSYEMDLKTGRMASGMSSSAVMVMILNRGFQS